FVSKRRTRHTLEERIRGVQSVIEDKRTIFSVAREYGVHVDTMEGWVRKYKANGIDGLKETKKWKQYSQELRKEAVEFHLVHGHSLRATCEQFNISTHSVLRGWIKLYTSGKEMKSTSKGRGKMSRGRKITFKERVEIVQYSLANDYNYHKAAEKYQVSYQQVYSWVRKYEKDGEQALRDRRGKTLESKQNLTEEEKLQLRIKELEHRTQYLEAENGLLKKLKEIERRR
ncbi:helix-turn-helix domain-containing protein, partial [Virgibacillus kekensis]